MNLGKDVEEKPLDKREIDLTWDVALGNHAAMLILYRLRCLHVESEDFPYIESLAWLKKNRIVGDLFVNWFNDQFEDNAIHAAQYLRQQVFRDFKLRPLIAKHRL